SGSRPRPDRAAAVAAVLGGGVQFGFGPGLGCDRPRQWAGLADQRNVITVSNVVFSKSLTRASTRIDHWPAGTSRRSSIRQMPGPVAWAARLMGSIPADGLAA